MRFSTALIILFLSFATQDFPDAATLKKQIQDASKERQSLQYVREITGEVTLDGKPVSEVNAGGRRIPVPTNVGKQIVALVNPGKARVELQLGAGNLMVSDGNTTWTYRPSTKIYSRLAAAQAPNGMAANLAVLDVLGFFDDPKSAKTVRDEILEVDGQIYDCWIVRSNVKIPAQAATGAEISDGVMEAWIDKKFFLQIQEVITYSYKVKPAAGAPPIEYQAKLKQLMRGLQVDQPIADELFVFNPPSGARELAMQTRRVDLTGKMAPPFKVVGLDGKAYSLDSLKGKIILLDFWASWCGPCIKSMPVLDRLLRDYESKGLVVLGINVDETRATVEKFLKKRPAEYPIIIDGESGVHDAYSVSVFPTFVLIGPDGKILAHQTGFSESALSRIVEKAGLR